MPGPQVPGEGLAGRWEPAAGAPDELLGHGIHLDFAAGTVVGRSGVNVVRGSYSVVPDPLDGTGTTGILALGPLVSTLMAGPPAAMAAERTFMELLGRVRGYQLERSGALDCLQLRDDAGVPLLGLVRAAAPPRTV